MHGYLLKPQRNRAVYLGGQLRIALQLHYSNRNGTFRLEGQLTRKHFVKHNAYRINIGLFVCALSPCLLGADVMNRTDSLIGYGTLLAPCKAGNAEIGHLNSAVGQHHYVLRLYVSVHNALIVRVLESL